MSLNTSMSPEVGGKGLGEMKDTPGNFLLVVALGQHLRFEHPEKQGVPVSLLHLYRLSFSIGAPASALISPAVVHAVEWREGRIEDK